MTLVPLTSSQFYLDQTENKFENPLVIWCKFGAVTNSMALTGTQTPAGLDVT